MNGASLSDRTAATWIVGGLSAVVALTWPGANLLEHFAAGGAPTMLEAIRLAVPLSALAAGAYLGSGGETNGRRSIREHIAAIALFSGATMPPVAAAAGALALSATAVPALALLAALLAATARGTAIIVHAIVRPAVLRSILVWGSIAAALGASAFYVPAANPIVMAATLTDHGSIIGVHAIVERWTPVVWWTAAAAVVLSIAGRIERSAREDRDG